jgi:hypothetical protein
MSEFVDLDQRVDKTMFCGSKGSEADLYRVDHHENYRIGVSG